LSFSVDAGQTLDRSARLCPSSTHTQCGRAGADDRRAGPTPAANRPRRPCRAARIDVRRPVVRPFALERRQVGVSSSRLRLLSSASISFIPRWFKNQATREPTALATTEGIASPRKRDQDNSRTSLRLRRGRRASIQCRSRSSTKRRVSSERGRNGDYQRTRPVNSPLTRKSGCGPGLSCWLAIIGTGWIVAAMRGRERGC
jgi:hypothetical protein